MAKILVTDDEDDMRLALMNTLELAGYQVIDADSGLKALERLKNEAVDIVLLDIQLPDMDGVEILKRIKSAHPHIPVIMVTGFGSLETAVQTVKLGAADYVSKPFENKDLFQRIEKALGAKKLKVPSGPITSRLMKEIGVEEVFEPEPGSDAPAPPPPPKPFPIKKALAAIGAAVTLGAALFTGYRWWAAGQVNFSIPTSHLSGITWDGERLWISDWFSQTIFECRPEGTQMIVHRSYHMPETRPTGIAWSGDALYIGDSWATRVARHALDANLTIVSSTGSPGPSPAGLFWDGERLWSTDSGARKIFRHSPGDFLRVDREYPAPGTSPIGLSVRDGAIWIADADTRRIYRYKNDTDFTPDGVFSHEILREATRPLSAFLIVKKQAWFGFEGENKIHRLRISRLKRVD